MLKKKACELSDLELTNLNTPFTSFENNSSSFLTISPRYLKFTSKKLGSKINIKHIIEKDKLLGSSRNFTNLKPKKRVQARASRVLTVEI